MRILSFIILLAALLVPDQKTESPHGAGFKVSCKTCHSSKGWQIDKEIYSFDHNKTRMPLTGSHTGTNCRLCHTSLVFSAAKRECYQCHNDIHQNTVGPDCNRCHTPVSWLVTNIEAIHRTSRFPLLGAHKTAGCIDCHKSESYARYDVPGVLCIDCHRADYNSAENPNHVQAGFSEDCSTCHPVNSLQWQGAGFNHSFFPLEQSHSNVKCVDCHTTGNYADAKPECISCHLKDYTSTTSPDHVTAKISTVCQDCHSLTPGWIPTTFDHSAFPLKLGHSTPACIDCHVNGNYTAISPDCYLCHTPDYNATTNPNHVTANYSKTCQTCHTLNPGWKPAAFNHGSFPLTQGHSAVACVDCHMNGNFTNTSTDCYSCHKTDYNNTTNPNHASTGFPTSCIQCHTTSPGWKPAGFNHGSFPLTLGHSTLKCADCHIGGNYTNTSADCYSCHQTDYNATTVPNHKTAGFPTTCSQCHSTNPGWKPASFSHTKFPLTLGHATPTCTDCHKNGNYTTTPTDCYSCHVNDYNTSTNPSHKTLAFSTVCSQCHTTNPGWQPASYTQHDVQMFPIYSGKHKGRWTVCSDCHTNPANYQLFDCKRCHTDAHRGKNYTNAQCYECHPRGTAG
jgi:hypothetical protein